MSCRCNGDPPPEKKRRNGKAANILAGSLMLLMPKCAVCWAAYLGIFGLARFSALTYHSWFLPAAALIFCLTLGHLLWRAINSRNYFAFLIALVAALLIGWQKWSGNDNGMGMVVIGLMGLAWLIDRKWTTIRPRFTRRPAE